MLVEMLAKRKFLVCQWCEKWGKMKIPKLFKQYEIAFFWII